MLDIITKAEYFECLNKNLGSKQDHTLKGIQDAWILSQFNGWQGQRLLEVGGGNSRVLPLLSGNQLWNVEKYEGVGNGPVEPEILDGVTVINAFMGEYHPHLPQVDAIFSISVIEHIPFEQYDDLFQDMARCLVPNGLSVHAIDLPIKDEPLPFCAQRIRALVSAVEKAGLEWLHAPSVDPDAVFTCDMASNSDLTMWNWAQISDASRLTGPHAQIVSLKLVARKPS